MTHTLPETINLQSLKGIATIDPETRSIVVDTIMKEMRVGGEIKKKKEEEGPDSLRKK